MPFTLSKILAFLAQPSTAAVAALAIGFVLYVLGRRPRLAAFLAWGGLLFLVIGGLSPLANALILPLEQRFAEVKEPERVQGIIILGGFEDGWVSAGRGGLAVNESAERLTEGLRLALRHPEARIVFTGGVGNLWKDGLDATQSVAAYFRDAGVDPSRLVLEGRSRNTYENAVLTRELVKPKAGETWLLVTSAYHMPRAVGLFRKVGFEVMAYPVDYRTRDAGDALRGFERIPAGLQRLDLAVGEWLGLVAYRLLGRMDDLFPAP